MTACDRRPSCLLCTPPAVDGRSLRPVMQVERGDNQIFPDIWGNSLDSSWLCNVTMEGEKKRRASTRQVESALKSNKELIAPCFTGSLSSIQKQNVEKETTKNSQRKHKKWCIEWVTKEKSSIDLISFPSQGSLVQASRHVNIGASFQLVSGSVLNIDDAMKDGRE